MAINTKGIYLACKYVVPIMLRQKSGCIINMASGRQCFGLAQRAAYTASKRSGVLADPGHASRLTAAPAYA